jgi:hypothetical protein
MGQLTVDDLRDAYRMYAAQGNVTGQERTAKQLAALGAKPPKAAPAPAPEPRAAAAGQRAAAAPAGPEGRTETPKARTTGAGRQAKT